LGEHEWKDSAFSVQADIDWSTLVGVGLVNEWCWLHRWSRTVAATNLLDAAYAFFIATSWWARGWSRNVAATPPLDSVYGFLMKVRWLMKVLKGGPMQLLRSSALAVALVAAVLEGLQQLLALVRNAGNLLCCRLCC